MEMEQAQKADRRVILAALWFGATLCYAYGDIIAFYEPGAVQRLLDGKMGFWDVTPGLLLGIAIFMSLPPVLAVLALLLPAVACRWINILFGALFSGVMLYTMIDAIRFGHYFYLYLGVIEVAMTLGVLACAATWSRRAIGVSTAR